MTGIPDKVKCLRILLNAGCERAVIEHCLAVEKLAVRIAERCKGVNTPILRAGALLHDVGRSKTHGLLHAVEGVKILEQMNIDERVIEIVRKHIGAGISPEEAERLGLPEGDYVPITLEEKIVCHADNLVGGPSYPDVRIGIDDVVEEFLQKGLPDTAVRARKLHDELGNCCNLDLDQL